jgi:serine protease inhibitor
MELKVVNRMYMQNNFTVLKEFRKTAKKLFRSETKEVDFVKNSDKARKVINKWVDKTTRHKITQIIEPGKTKQQGTR